MKYIYYILAVFVLITPAVVYSGDIPAYVLEKAEAAHISKVYVTIAKIKSIKKDENKVTIEIDGYAEIGSQKTQHMVYEEIYFAPRKEGEVRLIDIPEDSKEIKIYWGYKMGNFSQVIAFDKIR